MMQENQLKITTILLSLSQLSHAFAATEDQSMFSKHWTLGLFLVLFVLIVFLVIKVRSYGKNLAQLESELTHLSRTDDLTQLLNRRYLEKRLYEDFEWHLRNQSANSVLLMIEIDQFDTVTENFGHAAGDLVVQTVASIIQTRVRNTDLCGRYAEEAFLVLLRDITTDPAKTLADQVREKVSTTDMFYGQQSNNVSCSVGVAAYTSDMVSCRDWIQQAEQALYQAKQQGPNQTIVYATGAADPAPVDH